MEWDDREDVFQEYLRSIGFLLLLNLLLGSTKLILGYMGDSSAMRSDGFNNSADFLYSVLLAIGLWISTRPPDRSHPEGHARFESLMGTMIAVVIMGTGLYVLWDAYHAFLEPRSIHMGRLSIAVLSVSMVLKAAIAWFLIREEKRLTSPSLGAIGRDQAGDVLADLSVAAAIVAAVFELEWFDPLVAGVIGLVILKIGWEPFLENVRQLTGGAPAENVQRTIEQHVGNIEGLSRPSHVRAHHVGPVLHVSLTVKAPGEISLSEAHELEEELRQKILSIDRVERAFIHVEPYEADSPN